MSAAVAKRWRGGAVPHFGASHPRVRNVWTRALPTCSVGVYGVARLRAPSGRGSGFAGPGMTAEGQDPAPVSSTVVARRFFGPAEDLFQTAAGAPFSEGTVGVGRAPAPRGAGELGTVSARRAPRGEI